MATLEGHESTVWGLAFNNTGSQLGKITWRKSITLWRVIRMVNCL